MGSPVCAWASVVAVSRPPAAVAANMFRREIGFETTLMMLSLRWRRHDAPRFSLFGKRLTLAIPNVAGRKFDLVDEFGRSCRPVTKVTDS